MGGRDNKPRSLQKESKADGGISEVEADGAEQGLELSFLGNTEAGSDILSKPHFHLPILRSVLNVSPEVSVLEMYTPDSHWHKWVCGLWEVTGDGCGQEGGDLIAYEKGMREVGVGAHTRQADLL